MRHDIHVKCKCSHREHKGDCPHRACGCTVYRPDVRRPVTPKVPRIVRGAVVRELPQAAS